MFPNEEKRLTRIYKKWFVAFLCRDRSIAGNKLYTFPTNARRVFLKELLNKKLTERDKMFKKSYGVR